MVLGGAGSELSTDSGREQTGQVDKGAHAPGRRVHAVLALGPPVPVRCACVHVSTVCYCAFRTLRYSRWFARPDQ